MHRSDFEYIMLQYTCRLIDNYSDLKSCAALRFFPRYSMPAVQCSNNELESTLLQELAKWCNSVNAQR